MTFLIFRPFANFADQSLCTVPYYVEFYVVQDLIVFCQSLNFFGQDVTKSDLSLRYKPKMKSTAQHP